MSSLEKRVVFISPFFYPEPISTGKYNTDIVKELSEKGHKVTVICSHPFYPEWRPYKSTEEISNIEVIRGGSFIRYPNNIFLRRAILEIWFSIFIFFTFLKFRNKMDIVISVFPPSLAFYVIFPLISKKIKKIGIVHDLQEIHSNTKEGVLNKIVKYFIKLIERKCFKSCDKLLFLSEEMKCTAERLYSLEETKLKVQYPFINIDLNKVSDDLNDIFISSRKHIVYAGALGEKQVPKKLYQLFNHASHKLPNADFHFFSRGYNYEKLKISNKNNQIKFHDLVPENNLMEMYLKSSIQIIPQGPGTSKGSLPSKLPNILASGCNVLVITDNNSDLKKLFNKYKLNTVVTSWDYDEICRKIQSILVGDNTKNLEQIKIAKELFQMNEVNDMIIN